MRAAPEADPRTSLIETTVARPPVPFPWRGVGCPRPSAGATCLIQAVLPSEIYRFGGVEYSLRAIADGHYFLGHWRCGACEQEGASDARCASSSLAILAAKASLAEHHKLTHTGELPRVLRSE
jgi:hypothetical protein